MIYRRLDENGDMTFGGGVKCYISEDEAVAQAITTRLKLLYGEWWENQDDGLPLFQQILASRHLGIAKRLIAERIQSTEAVLKVENLDVSVDTGRKLKIKGTVTTLYGQFTLDSEGVA